MTIYANPAGALRATRCHDPQSGDAPEVIEYLKTPAGRRAVELIGALGTRHAICCAKKAHPIRLGLAIQGATRTVDFCLLIRS